MRNFCYRIRYLRSQTSDGVLDPVVLVASFTSDRPETKESNVKSVNSRCALLTKSLGILASHAANGRARKITEIPSLEKLKIG